MNWVNKQKLPAIEAIKYNNWLCFKYNKLQQVLYSIFNKAQNYLIDFSLLNKISNKQPSLQPLFSEVKFVNSIIKYNNLLTPSCNKLFWRHLKIIVKDSMCLKNIVNIADAYLELDYQPLHFKTSLSIIIPKPNKELYDSSKIFKPIVLLNTIEKLIEKVISKRLQFYIYSNNFIHLSQLDGLKQYFLSNTSITLTYFICTGWVKNNYISTLAFDIARFFSSLNHCHFSLIFNKMKFDSKVSFFLQLFYKQKNIIFLEQFLLFFFQCRC